MSTVPRHHSDMKMTMSEVESPRATTRRACSPRSLLRMQSLSTSPLVQMRKMARKKEPLFKGRDNRSLKTCSTARGLRNPTSSSDSKCYSGIPPHRSKTRQEQNELQQSRPACIMSRHNSSQTFSSRRSSIKFLLRAGSM